MTLNEWSWRMCNDTFTWTESVQQRSASRQCILLIDRPLTHLTARGESIIYILIIYYRHFNRHRAAFASISIMVYPIACSKCAANAIRKHRPKWHPNLIIIKLDESKGRVYCYRNEAKRYIPDQPTQYIVSACTPCCRGITRKRIGRIEVEDQHP